jgi:type III secretion protein U
MESEHTSEEKSLPASGRKLRELRRKGYVARSQEMVAAAVLAIAFVYIIMNGQTFVEGYRAAFEEITRQGTDDITIATSQVFKRVAIGIGAFVSLLYGLVILSTIVTSILVNGGFTFSVNHIKFNISNLSPIQGFKRIFSLRTAIDLSKKIIKLLILLVLSTVIIAHFINEPFYIPSCGLHCFQGILKVLFGLLLFVAVMLLLFAGLLDINIQRWLFQRQHKMTRSEAKRDRKEEEGSPEMLGYRRRLRHGILQASTVFGPADATIMIEGSNTIVGVRFIRGQTPIPIIVCKGRGGRSTEIGDIALEKKIPKYFDEELAAGLYRSHEPGGALTELYFDPFIRALKAMNLV